MFDESLAISSWTRFVLIVGMFVRSSFGSSVLELLSFKIFNPDFEVVGGFSELLSTELAPGVGFFIVMSVLSDSETVRCGEYLLWSTLYCFLRTADLVGTRDWSAAWAARTSRPPKEAVRSGVVDFVSIMVVLLASPSMEISFVNEALSILNDPVIEVVVSFELCLITLYG